MTEASVRVSSREGIKGPEVRNLSSQLQLRTSELTPDNPTPISTSIMNKSSASNFIVILVLAMVVSQCISQTFHYSHGWTNGKRSGPPSSLGSNSFRPENPYKSQELLQLLNEVEPLKPVNIESPLILLPVINGGRMASYKLYTMEASKLLTENEN